METGKKMVVCHGGGTNSARGDGEKLDVTVGEGAGTTL